MCVCVCVCVTLVQPSTQHFFTLKFPFFFSFFSHLCPYCQTCIFSLVVIWQLTADFSVAVLSSSHFLYIFLPQMTSPFPCWTSQSSLTNSSDAVSMLLPHHQAAAPTLPHDQSCLPEESASATRAHSSNGRNNNNNNNNNSHHSSPTYSNTIPEFMESVIDSVSICIWLILSVLWPAVSG